MKKQTKLRDGLQFKIKINTGIFAKTGKEYKEVTFLDIFDNPKYFGFKLTPSQWLHAKKYLSRELVAFQGYTYTPKENVKDGVYFIK